MPGDLSGDQPSLSRIQARRRRQLIEAAIDAIAGEGLSRVTLAKLAGRAGLSAAMVNFHFANKASLLLATLEALSAEFGREIEGALVAAGPDPRAKLAALIDTELSDRLCAPRKVAVWSAFWGESQARAEYQAVCGASDRDQSVLCRRLFEDALGPARTATAAPLAEAFLGLLDIQAQNLLADPAAFDHAAARALCHRYLAAVLPKEAGSPAAPNSQDVSRHWTLPAWSYASPALFQREAEVLHARHWHPACHLSQLPEPGDWVTFGLAGREALILRGQDGRVRAFLNLCRRRPHGLVADPRGRAAALLTCPHDGWRYDDKGRLRGVPDPAGLPEIDRDALGLQALDLEVYRGFVFLRFASAGTEEGPSVTDRLAPLAAALEVANLESLTPLEGGGSLELAADWKLLWDNDLESPRFAAPSKVHLKEGLVYASHARREAATGGWSARAYHRLAGQLPGGVNAATLAFFPGALLEIHPERVSLHHLQPLNAGRSRLTWTHFAPAAANDRPTRALRYLGDRRSAVCAGKVWIEIYGLLDERLRLGVVFFRKAEFVLGTEQIVVIDGEAPGRLSPENLAFCFRYLPTVSG